MKKKVQILSLILITSSLNFPVFADSTDLTITADVTDVVSLQLERTSDNISVSKDDLDSYASLGANEVLDFGEVNPLGLETAIGFNGTTVSRAITGTNGTSATLKSMVRDNSGTLYNPATAGTTAGYNGNANGSVYFIENALALRVLRTGAISSNIDMSNTGSFSAIVADQATLNFSASSSIPSANTLDAIGGVKSLTTNLTNNTAFPIDVGIIIPLNATTGVGNTTITFAAT